MILSFDILISLFERAYILLYEPSLAGKPLRHWRAWEDWIREWLRREDFRDALRELLRGEDPEFAAYVQKSAAEAAPRRA